MLNKLTLSGRTQLTQNDQSKGKSSSSHHYAHAPHTGTPGPHGSPYPQLQKQIAEALADQQQNMIDDCIFSGRGRAAMMAGMEAQPASSQNLAVPLNPSAPSYNQMEYGPDFNQLTQGRSQTHHESRSRKCSHNHQHTINSSSHSMSQ